MATPTDHPPVCIRRLILPMLLSFCLIWGSVGCFYIPWFEHRSDPQAKDFREMLDAKGSGPKIKQFISTRRQIIALLGEPPYESVDGKSVAYTLETETGVWLQPLCFKSIPADGRTYGLRLTFNDDDALARSELVHAEKTNDIFSMSLMYPGLDAIQMLNQSGPQLLPTMNAQALRSATLPSTR